MECMAQGIRRGLRTDKGGVGRYERSAFRCKYSLRCRAVSSDFILQPVVGQAKLVEREITWNAQKAILKAFLSVSDIREEFDRIYSENNVEKPTKTLERFNRNQLFVPLKQLANDADFLAKFRSGEFSSFY